MDYEEQESGSFGTLYDHHLFTIRFMLLLRVFIDFDSLAQKFNLAFSRLCCGV